MSALRQKRTFRPAADGTTMTYAKRKVWRLCRLGLSVLIAEADGGRDPKICDVEIRHFAQGRPILYDHFPAFKFNNAIPANLLKRTVRVDR